MRILGNVLAVIELDEVVPRRGKKNYQDTGEQNAAQEGRSTELIAAGGQCFVCYQESREFSMLSLALQNAPHLRINFRIPAGNKRIAHGKGGFVTYLHPLQRAEHLELHVRVRIRVGIDFSAAALIRINHARFPVRFDQNKLVSSCPQKLSGWAPDLVQCFVVSGE